MLRLRRYTVCTGRSKAILAFILLLPLMFSSCSRWQKPSHLGAPPKIFQFTLDQIPALLSGVWYHTKGEQPDKLVEREFSWGKTQFGYWNALVIDLLKGHQLVEASYGGGDQVTYDVDKSKPNLIHMHLGLSTGAGEEATIEIVTRNEIIFSYGDAMGGYYKNVNGTYYKSFDPGESEQ